MPIRRDLVLPLVALLSLPGAAWGAADEGADADFRQHCLSASPLKPFFGLVLVEYEYAPSHRWSVAGSVDVLYSRYLLSKTLGAVYGEGFEHPEFVARVGPRYWFSSAGQTTLEGPYVGATAGYLRMAEVSARTHALTVGAEGGWRFPFAQRRAMAMPRLQLSMSTADLKPLVGAELLLGMTF